MKLGIETAFNLINESGGIHGRQLRLVAADDGYEPTRTAETMKELYEKQQVFGFIGNVGTPTAVVALPYALERKALFSERSPAPACSGVIRPIATSSIIGPATPRRRMRWCATL
jgi:ABC-type branched-subunit amino acid transport system substrate-binding protein